MLALSLAACFSPELSAHPKCGANGACPDGRRCLHEVCVNVGCGAEADGTSCANTNVEDGVCYRGGCVPRGCGDGLPTSEEACDDGNLLSGDGCSGDCRSTEICGNGHLDAIAGEQCDEGILGLSADGCSSQCTVEVLDWRNVSPVHMRGLISPALAFDTHRGELVLFGGRYSIGDNTEVYETWEYSGGNWRQKRPAHHPTIHGDMTYDAGRKRVVLVGDGQTWEYDGRDWRLGPRPPTEFTVPLTYDSVRSLVLLLETRSGVGRVWTYDGVAWILMSTTGDSPTAASTFEYDANRDCAFVFSSSIHVLCGSTWSDVDESGSAPGGSAVVFSAECNCAIAFDGRDTWRFDGSVWKQMSVPSPTPRIFGYSIAYDAARDRIVLIGGASTAGQPIDETWEFDGDQWASRPDATRISPGDSPLVFDRSRARVLSFEGSSVWDFDGDSWRLRYTAHPAPSGPIVYHDDLDTIIGVDINGTWAFDGTDWMMRPTANGWSQAPETMVYDSVRDRLVLIVGGRDDFGETWEFNGTDWAQVLGLQPTPRFGHAIAFDRNRGRVVIYGGSKPVGMDGQRADAADLWEYDGQAWSEISSFSGESPGFRQRASAVFDPRTERVVLTGGLRLVTVPVSSETRLSDTWSWNGTAWTLVNTAARPVEGHGRLVDDPARRLHLFVGPGPSTWTLGYGSASHPNDDCVLDVDSDGDGLVACADPDCAGFCTRCGDGACERDLEYGVCAADCR